MCVCARGLMRTRTACYFRFSAYNATASYLFTYFIYAINTTLLYATLHYPPPFNNVLVFITTKSLGFLVVIYIWESTLREFLCNAIIQLTIQQKNPFQYKRKRATTFFILRDSITFDSGMILLSP